MPSWVMRYGPGRKPMTDQSAPPPAQVPSGPSVAPPSKFPRWALAGVVLAIAGIVGVASWFMTRSDLPGCDSPRTRNTLADIFKEKNVDVLRYDEIKTVERIVDDIYCHATLTLRDDSKLEIDYRLYRGDTGNRLLITRP